MVQNWSNLPSLRYNIDIFYFMELDGNTEIEWYAATNVDSLSVFSSDIYYLTALGQMKGMGSMSNMTNQVNDYQQGGGRNYGPEFLIWNHPVTQKSPLFPEEAPEPYIVLMESTNKSMNVGKLNIIAVGILIDEVFEGERRIQRSGQNQVKITCSSRIDANTLLRSDELIDSNFRVYIPNSLCQNKGLIRDVGTEFLAKEIAEMIPQRTSGMISSIKRRVDYKQQITENMEFAFMGKQLPEIILIKSCEFLVSPIIPRPVRCYRHIGTQCRTRNPRCEFCSGDHAYRQCNSQRDPVCYHCRGRDLVSSKDCPRYIKELEICQIRSDLNCGLKRPIEFTTLDTLINNSWA